jgi:hypothetical protein
VAAAAPRVEEAARLLSPKIDIARDKLKDEVLPTIVDAVNRAAEVAAQSAGQAAGAPAIGVPAAASAACSASVSRATKKRHRVRRFLGWSALAALVGAIAYAMWTRREPDGDPWSEDDAWGDDPAAFVPTTQGSGETADGDGLAATAKDGLEDLAEVAGAAADAVGVKTGEAVRKVSTASKKAAAVAQTAIDKARRAADAGAEEPTPGPDHP